MTAKLFALWTASLVFGSAAAEPSLPDIYNGYREARRSGTLPTPDRRAHPISLWQRPGATEQIVIDWKEVFLQFFPQEIRRLEKFNSVKAVTWASGNFDFDPANEVLVSLSAMQAVGSYSDVELPIAPVYQVIFVADKEGRTIRNESIVPLVLNVTRDTDIDCGNCGGPQTIFSLVATQDYNSDATLEVVLQKTTQWRRATPPLNELQLYANASQGWVPIQLDAPVLSEY